ncbi:helix-turn-helix domain-containing protein [Bradyrhizobium nanningense]|uniref:helix-turn-helix domain-containing protein n=1 Tax=Bradyrhizobium nanningense TaxID=1325118 RepID=UPI003D313F26
MSAVERRVGAALLDSFNRKTRQCDPSLERVAGLLNVHRRTVIRATAKLEAQGLFRKIRHGGHSHRNQYEPIWSRFTDLEARWRSRFEAAARERRTGMSSLAGPESHNTGDPGVPQTCFSNQSKLTSSDRRVDATDGRRGLLGTSEGSAVETRQPALFATASPTKTSTRSLDAARTAAERRWSNDLLREFSGRPAVYASVVDFIDERLQTAATDAELCRRGRGSLLIVERYLEGSIDLGSRMLRSGEK